MNTVILATYTGPENTSAIVAQITDGFSVVLKDEDSGEFLDVIRIFKTREAAEAYAKTIEGA